jgi:glycosyltransferase involved in cell wall biosynthesis
MRLGYLYSRYPVISQTFCDSEMLALERSGFFLEIGSVYSPLTSLRHEYISRLRAPIHYAPPQQILRIWEKKAKANGSWPAALIDLHERKFGPRFKPGQRARNALYFARLFARNGVEHFHVHFANRAAHTALFVKKISSIPFSVTAHGQDFMVDLGNDDLLREICAAAEFVAAETDYSRDLLCQRCPDSAAKIHRVYNGIDLEQFPPPLPPITSGAAARILSVGRLVPFKGFEYLLDACVELVQRGLDFTCEIVGDGPLRQSLQTKIGKLGLSHRVVLLGSLSQAAVFQKLRSADIFALACVVDQHGASDVFPTVILEAMSAARPVVTTRLAGIPELVAHEQTGLLVPPGDRSALADALHRLIRDPALRARYGQAGRERVEQDFRIEKTVVPLVQLLQKSSNRDAKPAARQTVPQIAYIIDRWPDEKLPFLTRELCEINRQSISVVPFVCEVNSAARFNRTTEELVERMEFLPDATVVEAEWRASPAFAQELEDTRAKQEARPPPEIFLRQARFALVLRKLLDEQRISHLHATSSRALVCALNVREITGVTVSATIEPRPDLPRSWIETALRRCEGGRVADASLTTPASGKFLFDKAAPVSFPKKTVRLLGEKFGIDLTTPAGFWQEWSALLARWSSQNAEKIKKRIDE